MPPKFRFWYCTTILIWRRVFRLIRGSIYCRNVQYRFAYHKKNVNRREPNEDYILFKSRIIRSRCRVIATATVIVDVDDVVVNVSAAVAWELLSKSGTNGIRKTRSAARLKSKTRQLFINIHSHIHIYRDENGLTSMSFYPLRVIFFSSLDDLPLLHIIADNSSLVLLLLLGIESWLSRPSVVRFLLMINHSELERTLHVIWFNQNNIL